LRLVFVFSVVLLAFFSTRTEAAACTGCTNPRLQNNLGLDARNPQAGALSLRLSLGGTQTHASHAVDEEQYEPNHDPNQPGPHAHVQAATHDLDFILANFSLGLDYAFSTKGALSLQVPLRRVDVVARFLDEAGGEMTGFESIHHRTETLQGLGDPELGYTHLLLQPTARLPLTLLLTGGLSLPLGGVVENPFELGREGKDHQHIFFGTGTVDPLLGVALAFNRVTWGAAGYARLRHALYSNHHDYNAGTEMTAGLSAGSGFGLEGLNLRASTEVFWQRPARWGDEVAKNSGRIDLIPGLSLSYAWKERLTVMAMLRRPITLAVEGGQLDLGFHGALGLRWLVLKPAS